VDFLEIAVIPFAERHQNEACVQILADSGVFRLPARDLNQGCFDCLLRVASSTPFFRGCDSFVGSKRTQVLQILCKDMDKGWNPISWDVELSNQRVPEILIIGNLLAC